MKQNNIRNTKGAAAVDLLGATYEAIRSVLPKQWASTVRRDVAIGERRADMIIEITAPDSSQTFLIVEAKNTSQIQQIRSASAQLRLMTSAAGDLAPAVGLVAAPYLGPAARSELERDGVGYADLTGNMSVTVDRPALHVRLSGADRNPSPDSRGLKKLSGASAAATLRALLDWMPPYGIRQIADLAGLTPSTVTRVVELLDTEGLVDRDQRGGISDLNWPEVLDRWAVDYSVTESNSVAAFLEPRGVERTIDRLRGLRDQYAVTGTLAVPSGIAVAPVVNIMIFSPTVAQLAVDLELRAADSGANVLLMRPLSDSVFARTREVSGVKGVALSQVAIDLMTGPGRGSSEASELRSWMASNEEVWRA